MTRLQVGDKPWMYILYSIAISLLFLTLIPYFIYQALRHGKYAGSFKERLGWLPLRAKSDGRPTAWIHAVSVGEFLAARPLIAALRRQMPEHRLVVSTTTLTGQRLALDSCPRDFDAVFYFPFDWNFAVRRALNHVRPDLVVLIETELWPNFLRQCRLRGVVTVVANGRLSPRSFARYRLGRGFISLVMSDVSLMIMQSEPDGERARLLGARPDSVRVCGNIKYDVELGDDPPLSGNEELDQQFALSASRHLIVAGSTAAGEEEIILDALRSIRRAPGLEDTRLVIAPRHPERFDEVARLIAQSEFKFTRRSGIVTSANRDAIGMQAPSCSSGPLSQASRSADVVLLDSIGELAALYRYAHAVFVGGSLVPRGGHNIIEPAAHARPIVVGPHMENFRQIVSDFAAGDAVVQVTGAGSLAAEMIRILSDAEASAALGARARGILEKGRGATECTLAAIRPAVRQI